MNNEEKLYKLFRKAVFILTGILMLILVINILNRFIKSDSNEIYYYDLTDNVSISVNGKDAYTGNLFEYDHGKYYPGDTVEITVQLPDKEIRNSIIAFYNSNAYVNAYYDNKLIYSNGTYDGKKRIVGMGFEKIPIKEGYANKKIMIEMTPVDHNYNVTKIKQIHLVNVMDFDKNRVVDNFYNIIISIFLLFLGFASLLFSYTYCQIFVRRIQWLAVMCILCSIWIIHCFSLAEYIYSNKTISYAMEYEMIFFLGAFINMYAVECIENEKHKDILEKCFFGMLTFIATVTFLQFTEVLFLGDILWVFHILSAIDVAFVMKYIVEEIKKKTFIKYMIVACLVGAIGYMLIYTIFRNSVKVRSISLLSIFPFLFLIWTFFNYLNYFVEMSGIYMTTTEMGYLIQLAYKDALTGAYNRSAFDERIKFADADEERNYTVIVFDINNLKYTNDIYGHTSGDELIKTFSAAAMKYFNYEEFSFCRTGGDEFTAIIPTDNESEVMEKLGELRREIREINSKRTQYLVSYACGYERSVKPDGYDIKTALYYADEHMYVNKQEIKEKEKKEKEKKDKEKKEKEKRNG